MINIGIHIESGHTAALAILAIPSRKQERITEVFGDDPWYVLVETLEQCQPLKVPSLRVIANNREFVKVFTKPIAIKQPEAERKWMIAGANEEWVKVWRGGGWTKQPTVKTKRGGRGYWAEIPVGGHPGQWRTIWILQEYDDWQFLFANELTATKEVWNEYRRAP